MNHLTKYQFLVLTALLRRPMHPYAIRDEIIQLSGNRLFAHHTTIHKALIALRKLHLVEDGASDPYYWLKARRGTPLMITSQGRFVVRKELAMYHTIFSTSWKRLEE